MPIIAPWLQPANVLGAMQAGGSLGLQQRAANQRDAEMAQRAMLAEQENARQQAAAEMQLRYHYDSLQQARELAKADDEARNEQNKFLREQAGLKLLQDKAEADALAAYREGMLKNASERTAATQAAAAVRDGKPIHVGKSLLQFDPASGGVKTLYTEPDRETIPMVHGVEIDPMTSAKISLRANDPLLNRYLGTNAAMLGTNYVSRPTAKAPAQAVAEPVSDEVGDEEGGPAQPISAKPLDKATAAQFLKAAGGDKKKARELAKQAGYTF